MQLAEEVLFVNIHKGLQNCMSICKAKKHDQVLKMTKGYRKLFSTFLLYECETGDGQFVGWVWRKLA